jgi:hypothetical protein
VEAVGRDALLQRSSPISTEHTVARERSRRVPYFEYNG